LSRLEYSTALGRLGGTPRRSRTKNKRAFTVEMEKLRLDGGALKGASGGQEGEGEDGKFNQGDVNLKKG